MEYKVVRCGKEYGIWGMRSNCVLIYGTKKNMVAMCNKLSKIENRRIYEDLQGK